MLFNGKPAVAFISFYELAVAAQLPMLSVVGFEAVHKRPVMEDKDYY